MRQRPGRRWTVFIRTCAIAAPFAFVAGIAGLDRVSSRGDGGTGGAPLRAAFALGPLTKGLLESEFCIEMVVVDRKVVVIFTSSTQLSVRRQKLDQGQSNGPTCPYLHRPPAPYLAICPCNRTLKQVAHTLRSLRGRAVIHIITNTAASYTLSNRTDRSPCRRQTPPASDHQFSPQDTKQHTNLLLDLLLLLLLSSSSGRSASGGGRSSGGSTSRGDLRAKNKRTIIIAEEYYLRRRAWKSPRRSAVEDVIRA